MWTRHRSKIRGDNTWINEEENDWDCNTSYSCGVKEGPVDCFRLWEVTEALERMKHHKAAGMLGVITETLQATDEVGS